jgi:hypothetical protein
MTLTKVEDLVASEVLRCDASADFVSQLVANNDSAFRWIHLPVVCKIKFCKILVGQRYKRYEFVDEDGEVHEFKCVGKLDDYMKRHKLYPEFILNQLEKLKS